jgi:hypothetical protein
LAVASIGAVAADSGAEWQINTYLIIFDTIYTINI